MNKHPELQYPDIGARARMPRRSFLQSSTAGVVAGAIAAATPLPEMALAQREAVPAGSGTTGRRILVKGGIVLSMDRNVGDFEKADVLIDGKKIAQVGPNLKATGKLSARP